MSPLLGKKEFEDGKGSSDEECGLHLQVRGLPLQSLHLQELRLLIRAGAASVRGAALTFAPVIC